MELDKPSIGEELGWRGDILAEVRAAKMVGAVSAVVLILLLVALVVFQFGAANSRDQVLNELHKMQAPTPAPAPSPKK